MLGWEYARILVAPPRIIDRSDVGDERVVITINGHLQDYKKNPANPYDILNSMGAEGWELITVLALVPSSPNFPLPTGIWEYVLKRQISSQ